MTIRHTVSGLSKNQTDKKSARRIFHVAWVLFSFVSLAIPLSGCGAAQATPEPTSTAPAFTATPQPPTTTPTAVPSPTPTATPRVCTALDIYVGKDANRQPDLVQQPVAPVITLRELIDSGEESWLTGSYVSVFLNKGRTTLGDDLRGTRESLLALATLLEAAVKAEHFPTVVSGYRTIDEQAGLSSLYGQGPGVIYAEAGRSEHQLGTAYDLGWAGSLLDFYTIMNDETAKAFYRWLKENASQYGFVISYPYKERDGKYNLYEPFITEYKAETWHIRYVGKELADRIYQAGYLDSASDIVPQNYYCP